MGKYDFTTRPNRLGQNTVKWHSSESNKDLLQMWVADMDFLPVPAIKEAIIEYGENHVFGYPHPSDTLFESIVNWEKKSHGYDITKEKITLIEGVVPAISSAIQAFTKEGEAILINTPVYPPFSRSVKLNNRKLISNPLIIRNGHFEIDFDLLEEDLINNDVKLYIFCNPHNPGGRVWSKEELTKVAELCKKHNILLVSDEIHQDLVLFGNKHISMNTIDDGFKDFTIVLASATKTFNIAGTKNSFAMIENADLRKTFRNRQLMNNQHEIPAIGLITTEAAFTYGKAWLDELKPVLEKNINYVVDYLSEKTNIKVMKPEGTYLIWLDFSAYNIVYPEITKKLEEEGKVVLNDGASFGKEGRSFARLNVATPFETVKEVCTRIAKVFPK
jgi:cystathionine beta-lyase